MSLVDLQNVGKSYAPNRTAPSVRVLSGVNEQITEGEFVAIMGPSGSGKSTLLTIVGAMNQPTEGRLFVDGIDVYGLSDEARADFRKEYLGFVFQQHHLMPFLTALENAMLPLATFHLSSSRKREKASAVLDRVGLADKAHRFPNQLSGGEQGRLAIARALINDPPIVLADEPTGALDTQTGQEIMNVFASLNRQGQTLILVTHNPDNALIAERTIHLLDGYVVTTPSGQADLPSCATDSGQ